MSKSRISSLRIGLKVRKPLPKQTEKVIPDKTKYKRSTQKGVTKSYNNQEEENV